MKDDIAYSIDKLFSLWLKLAQRIKTVKDQHFLLIRKRAPSQAGYFCETIFVIDGSHSMDVER